MQVLEELSFLFSVRPLMNQSPGWISQVQLMNRGVERARMSTRGRKSARCRKQMPIDRSLSRRRKSRSGLSLDHLRGWVIRDKPVIHRTNGRETGDHRNRCTGLDM